MAPRVAFDVTPLQNAHQRRGIGTYVRGLAERLNAQDDVPLEFWGWRAPLPFAINPAHRTLLLPTHPMPQHRGAWLFAQAWLRRAAARSDAGAVHVSDPNALLILAGRRMMTTVHDLIPLTEGMPSRRVVQRLGYARYLQALREVDTLFVNSTDTAAHLAAATGRPLADIVLAAPGVELRDATAPAPDALPQFLYVGGPDPTKNVGTLLEAMALVPDLPERLVIAGHWTRRQRFRLAQRLRAMNLQDRVEHLGYVSADRLERLYAGATAVVVPSRREGFGLPVAEAMARGVPVAHSDLAVLREVSGGHAVTFDPGSAADLARALRELSGDPARRRALGAEGRERAAALTWDDAVAATLARYRRALG